MPKRLPLVLSTVLLATALSVPAAATPALVAGSAAPVVAPSLAAAETYATGVRQFTFVDTTRPTAANGAFPAASSRTLETTVLYPAAGPPGGAEVPDAAPAVGRRFPLVVFSHGFTASGPIYRFLLRRFAAAGYVVAAPTFPLSSGAAPGGPAPGDYVNQPADVSFVIDEMLALDGDRQSELSGTIQRTRVAAAGHSLGAITTLGFRNSCCTDRRVDALVSIAGAQLPFPDGSVEDSSRTPTLLIHGEADDTVPYAASQAVFDAARAPKFLLTLLGAGHNPFFGPAGEVLVASTVNFLDRYLKGDRAALDELVAEGNQADVATLVGDGNAARQPRQPRGTGS